MSDPFLHFDAWVNAVCAFDRDGAEQCARDFRAAMETFGEDDKRTSQEVQVFDGYRDGQTIDADLRGHVLHNAMARAVTKRKPTHLRLVRNNENGS
jgi:hypothetical protein